MSPRQMFIIVALGVIALLTYASFFTVSERELAIKFKLGDIAKADYEPGLYFQMPFVNNVIKYERRILMLDVNPTEYLTIEKKKLVVDFYAKWRIIDIGKFYRTMSQGNVNTARQRIYKIINNGLKSQFSQYALKELVSGEKIILASAPAASDTEVTDIRDLVMKTVTDQANTDVAKYGISILDIRIKRIDLTQKIEKDVFARMRSEREQFAAEIRASGKEESEKMRANADKERTILLAKAYEIAEKTRGFGDAKSAETYANAYGRDKEFYAFYRSMDAYKNSFSGDSDILVLEPNSDFFKYFKKNK